MKKTKRMELVIPKKSTIVSRNVLFVMMRSPIIFVFFTLFLISTVLSSSSAEASGPYAYITNLMSNNVSVIDTSSNKVIVTVPVGASPWSVAANPTNGGVYVANGGSNSLSVIDTHTHTVAATVGLDGSPFGVAVNSSGTRVYVGIVGENKVSVIDTSNMAVIATVPVAPTPYGIAVNRAGTRVYVANIDSNKVSIIDTSSNTLIATVSVGSNPYGVAVNDVGTRIYISNFTSKDVSVIDTTSNTVIANVSLSASPYGIAVNPLGDRVYVAQVNNDVSVIDTNTNTVIATVLSGVTPFGIAVNPSGTRVYVANANSNYVSIIDTSSNTVIDVVAVGNNPRSLGNFIGSLPIISASPNSKDFGSVTSGSSSGPQTITIANEGSENLNITSFSFTGGDVNEFEKQSDTCSNQVLSPNLTCTLQLVFSPTSAGSKTTSLAISSNDPNNATLSLALSGTGTIPDTIPPTVTLTHPANNAVGVAINSVINATFSEGIDASTITGGNFMLNEGTVSGTVTYDPGTKVATFTPSSSLAYSTAYTAKAKTGVKDSSGNNMAADYSWTFTTGTAPDTTPPAILSVSPPLGSTGVEANSIIRATFSEGMTASTVNTGTFTLVDSSGNQIQGIISMAGNTVTFTPSLPLGPPYQFTARISGEVKDLAGNAMASDFAWTFFTRDVSQPIYSNGNSRAAISSVANTGTITIQAPQGVTLSDVRALSDTDAALNQSNKPAGLQFPDGMVSFKASGVSIGGTIQITLDFPTLIGANSKIYKVGRSGFYDFASRATISGNSVTMTLTDGEAGDDDGTANGVITDPVGVASSVDGNGTATGGGNGGCFIATAAYGSPMAYEVCVLRQFRDEYLLPTLGGKCLVDLYYQYSPPAANYIARHESVRTAARIVLMPVVFIVKYPIRAILIFLVMGGGGLSFIRRGRKTRKC